MPNIRIDEELNEYLREHSNGESYNQTIKRMLGIGKLRGKTVRKQADRAKLAPIEVYNHAALLGFGDETELSRNQLQQRVQRQLEGWGVFQVYRMDEALMRHGQPRWKSRFGSALDYLKKQGAISPVGSYTHNYEGGMYQITEKGRELLRSNSQLNMLLENKDYEALNLRLINSRKKYPNTG